MVVVVGRIELGGFITVVAGVESVRALAADTAGIVGRGRPGGPMDPLAALVGRVEDIGGRGSRLDTPAASPPNDRGTVLAVGRAEDPVGKGRATGLLVGFGSTGAGLIPVRAACAGTVVVRTVGARGRVDERAGTRLGVDPVRGFGG